MAENTASVRPETNKCVCPYGRWSRPHASARALPITRVSQVLERELRVDPEDLALTWDEIQADLDYGRD